MSDHNGASSNSDPIDGGEMVPLDDCLVRLAAGDLTARDAIIERCANQFRRLTKRMLSGFPNVRRWDDTDDVFQNAVMRLYRTLAHLPITQPREVMALAATELHRELIDLARKHSGPMSFAANHATNLPWREGPQEAPLPVAVSEAALGEDLLDRWGRFHEAVTTLAPELREVFQFVWYLDADTATIARLLACSERTVQRRWNDARLAVRVKLDGERPE